MENDLSIYTTGLALAWMAAAGAAGCMIFSVLRPREARLVVRARERRPQTGDRAGRVPEDRR